MVLTPLGYEVMRCLHDRGKANPAGVQVRFVKSAGTQVELFGLPSARHGLDREQIGRRRSANSKNIDRRTDELHRRAMALFEAETHL